MPQNDPQNRPGQQEFGDLASQIADMAQAEEIINIDDRVTVLEAAPAPGANLSPASEELTGDTWSGKPVWRIHLAGAELASGVTITAGVDELVRVFGFSTSTSSAKLPFAWTDGSNAMQVIVDAADDLVTSATGTFVGKPFAWTIEFTKV